MSRLYDLIGVLNACRSIAKEVTAQSTLLKSVATASNPQPDLRNDIGPMSSQKDTVLHHDRNEIVADGPFQPSNSEELFPDTSRLPECQPEAFSAPILDAVQTRMDAVIEERMRATNPIEEKKTSDTILNIPLESLRNDEPKESPMMQSKDLADSSTLKPQGRPLDVAETIIEDLPKFELSESRVPSSRFGRLMQYGGLATGMGFGAVSEAMRRATGGANTGGSVMMSEANVTRLVNSLSKMRGAALKLGQMLSIQDSHLLPKQIEEVMVRVQNQANYMPKWQMERVMMQNLGSAWRTLFDDFSEKPIAAASIGQVHSAVYRPSGMSVAVKVQYPGVAESIDSDLNNLKLLVSASRLLPRGLYLENSIKVLRHELQQETDYIREAESMSKFKDFLSNDKAFKVPSIIQEASAERVLTSERLNGQTMSYATRYDQPTRDAIGSNILRLSLMELFKFRFMQTDPNPTNFFYNPSTRKIELLDFGATREFSAEFTSLYLKLLLAAAEGDRQAVAQHSEAMGYLTGLESPSMLNAHVDSVLVLGEPFRHHGIYDFDGQTVTDRVRDFIPVMLRERLTPPPEETYTLHRKLSGAFLLCARLRSKVDCRQLLLDAEKEYN